ncbi:MAG: hypothetical protein OES24_03625 [Acidimicrobiia bacterium]|nr:hypothetical protein [Acidimicrobiia bacterium]
MARTLVITASGRESFTGRQLQRLDQLGSIDGDPVDIVGRVEPLSDAEFVRLARPYDVVALTRRPRKYLDRGVLSRLPNLQAVVVHTTGVHWVDVEYLTERDVDVLSLGGYATESVAEHTLAGILMLSRRTHLSFDRARGLIPATVSLRGFELRNRIVGIVGYGRIGRRVHELLAPMTTNILVHDPAHRASLDLATVLGRSELLVLAASSDYGRAPIIGASELAVTSARYVVNAACDELVDHNAVVEAIRQRRIDGYVLDEFDETLAEADVEPGRIVQTMHTGWYSDEAMERGKEEWVGMIERAAVSSARSGPPIGERRAA